MRRFVIGFFATVGVLVVLFVVGGVIAFEELRPTEKPLPDKILLTVDLTKGLAEGRGAQPLLKLFVPSKPTVRDVVDALEDAGNDSRVKGLFVRLGTDNVGLANIQQLRDAIAAFRATGKFTVAYADSFGEFGPGTRPLYLASAFNEVWLQPMGTVGLDGLLAQVPFFKGTLDLVGIKPSFARREQFKTAINSLTETKMTPAHREEVKAILDSTGKQIVDGLAKGRDLSPEQIRADMNRGPFFANAAWRAQLVDRLGYRDEAIAHARQRAGSGTKAVSLDKYLHRVGRPHKKGPTIALIYGIGLIQTNADTRNPLFGSEVMSADQIGKAFRKAVDDPAVRAIVFRIDSPGGSVVASESIWRDVLYARERGKPVIVSMGDVAGSGGYYIAAGADKIVAEPGTLTGSIGVFAGKLVLAGLFKKLGVTTDSEQIGDNATMFSASSDFTPAEHHRLETLLDDIYAGFKEHVAAGRQMTADQVEAVAKGRVWTGAQAKSRGLVDALGGYRTAFRLARQAAGIARGAAYKVEVFPPRKGTLERLYDRLTGQGSDDDAAILRHGAAARTLAAAAPLLRRVDRLLARSGAAGVLTMPPLSPPR